MNEIEKEKAKKLLQGLFKDLKNINKKDIKAEVENAISTDISDIKNEILKLEEDVKRKKHLESQIEILEYALEIIDDEYIKFLKKVSDDKKQNIDDEQRKIDKEKQNLYSECKDIKCEQDIKVEQEENILSNTLDDIDFIPMYKGIKWSKAPARKKEGEDR